MFTFLFICGFVISTFRSHRTTTNPQDESSVQSRCKRSCNIDGHLGKGEAHLPLIMYFILLITAASIWDFSKCWNLLSAFLHLLHSVSIIYYHWVMKIMFYRSRNSVIIGWHRTLQCHGERIQMKRCFTRRKKTLRTKNAYSMPQMENKYFISFKCVT